MLELTCRISQFRVFSARIRQACLSPAPLGRIESAGVAAISPKTLSLSLKRPF